MSSEQPSIIENGGGAGHGFATRRPVVRGVGLGCALAGFGALVAAELLPWISMTTAPLQQDFPTASGGRLERGLDELPVGTEIFKLGWLLVLAAVATALAVRVSLRRTAVATGLGLVAGQLAMLVGMTRAVKHNGVFRGTATPADLPVQLETGLYCAYAALLLFALALLFAGGVPRWLRRRVLDAPAATEYGPADLTVSAAPVTDPALWSRAQAERAQAERAHAEPAQSPWNQPDPTRNDRVVTDIEVGGRQPER